ncbi:hypothetical protein B0H13DRAFT_1852559 [Mycena leptocephala]|nr:hypothetical protein B0H13DRAFT_1852559 [Mycena leptocephala]
MAACIATSADVVDSQSDNASPLPQCISATASEAVAPLALSVPHLHACSMTGMHARSAVIVIIPYLLARMKLQEPPHSTYNTPSRREKENDDAREHQVGLEVARALRSISSEPGVRWGRFGVLYVECGGGKLRVACPDLDIDGVSGLDTLFLFPDPLQNIVVGDIYSLYSQLSLHDRMYKHKIEFLPRALR